MTIGLDRETVEYFKGLSSESGIPYQTLINLYLRDCASNRKRLSVLWESTANQGAAQLSLDPTRAGASFSTKLVEIKTTPK